MYIILSYYMWDSQSQHIKIYILCINNMIIHGIRIFQTHIACK